MTLIRVAPTTTMPNPGPPDVGGGPDIGQIMREAGGIGRTAGGLTQLLGNVPGLEDVGGAVPFIGPAANLIGFGGTVAGGDPTSILTSIPGLAGGIGEVAGSGALGATMAGLAPALGTIGAFAIPAAVAAYFAMNDSTKDAERRKAELHEWSTAKRDLAPTVGQTKAAWQQHAGYADPGALSDEQLQNATAATQTGLLAQNPLSHSLMQLQSGEEFAGIPGVNISTPQAFYKAVTPIISRDYLTAADEYAKRGLTLGGDAKTAMHGSMYDSPEEQWRVNAPDPAQMLKSWAVQFDPNSAQAKKVNDILDASRSNGVESFNIPGWEKGHYGTAFDDFTKNILTVDPMSLTNPTSGLSTLMGQTTDPTRAYLYNPMTGGGA